MRTIIIEDEEQAISALLADIKKHCPELEIIGTTGSVEEGISLIQKINPELIFLDIQLSDGLGFDILEIYKNSNFKIIFTTAYSQYAIKAIKFSALDYLLKPIDTQELRVAVKKALETNKESNQSQIENFIKNQNLLNPNKRIALQTSQGVFLHELQTIIRCNSEGNYTSIHFTNGKRLLIAKPLKEYEDILSTFGFERIHHSHIINLNHLVSYLNKDGGYVVLSDNTSLPVSSRKKAQLLKMLENYNS
jgi:two-component system LytT family response regulator